MSRQLKGVADGCGRSSASSAGRCPARPEALPAASDRGGADHLLNVIHYAGPAAAASSSSKNSRSRMQPYLITSAMPSGEGAVAEGVEDSPDRSAPPWAARRPRPDFSGLKVDGHLAPTESPPGPAEWVGIWMESTPEEGWRQQSPPGRPRLRRGYPPVSACHPEGHHFPTAGPAVPDAAASPAGTERRGPESPPASGCPPPPLRYRGSTLLSVTTASFRARGQRRQRSPPWSQQATLDLDLIFPAREEYSQRLFSFPRPPSPYRSVPQPTGCTAGPRCPAQGVQYSLG